MHFVYQRIYLPNVGKYYCVTNKEQHDLSSKYPQLNIVTELNLLKDKLSNSNKRLSATKMKLFIEDYLNGASDTRS